MKKASLYIVALLLVAMGFASCIKNGKDRTVETKMISSIAGKGTFTATTVEPGTITPQLNDSTTRLLITGIDRVTGYKIMLSVTKYTEQSGTFSIADSQATAVFYHDDSISYANSGVVAIKEVGANVIIGYFSFTTYDKYSITNGDFAVARPWKY